MSAFEARTERELLEKYSRPMEAARLGFGTPPEMLFQFLLPVYKTRSSSEHQRLFALDFLGLLKSGLQTGVLTGRDVEPVIDQTTEACIREMNDPDWVIRYIDEWETALRSFPTNDPVIGLLRKTNHARLESLMPYRETPYERARCLWFIDNDLTPRILHELDAVPIIAETDQDSEWISNAINVYTFFLKESRGEVRSRVSFAFRKFLEDRNIFSQWYMYYERMAHLMPVIQFVLPQSDDFADFVEQHLDTYHLAQRKNRDSGVKDLMQASLAQYWSRRGDSHRALSLLSRLDDYTNVERASYGVVLDISKKTDTAEEWNSLVEILVQHPDVQDPAVTRNYILSSLIRTWIIAAANSKREGDDISMISIPQVYVNDESTVRLDYWLSKAIEAGVESSVIRAMAHRRIELMLQRLQTNSLRNDEAEGLVKALIEWRWRGF